MGVNVVNVSRGPALEPGVEKGVHIIFIPPEVEADPGPRGLPNQGDLEAVAMAVPNAAVTDVIVYRGKPWHKVGRTLEKHPQVHTTHPETVLELRVEQQKAVWWSEHEFKIVGIELDQHAVAAAAPGVDNVAAPPSRPFPVPETRVEDDIDSVTPQRLHVARSTVPVREAKTHEYKITFTRTGHTIDPNMRCV